MILHIFLTFNKLHDGRKGGNSRSPVDSIANRTRKVKHASGQVDLIATGNTVAAAIASKNPDRAPVLKFVIKDSPCYVGMNKEEAALKAKINAIIAKAKADGELTKLSMKWLKAPLPPGF